MPQFNYDHPTLLLGQIASTVPWNINSYLNALLAQSNTVTISATPVAGDYTIEIVAPEGTFTFAYTSPGGEAEGDIVAGLLAALDADPDLANIVLGTDADPVLELDFIHPGIDYLVTLTVNPGSDMTLAETQAAGGSDIALGIAVVASDPAVNSTGAQHVVAPDAGSVDVDFLGLTVKAVVDIQVNTGDANAETQAAKPGATVSAMDQGEAVAATEQAVAFNDPVFVRIANPGAGQQLGGLRMDTDGGDAVQMTGARWRSATTGAGQLAKVRLNRPA